MDAKTFLSKLTSTEWRSKGDSTLRNKSFNDFPDDDWRNQIILANESYYPPGNVHIKVVPTEIKRSAYVVRREDHDVHIPESVMQTFRLEVAGDEFDGKELLQSARFVVLGDHAISSPMTISSARSVVIKVNLHTLTSGKLVMVNELIWSVQYENSKPDGRTFYDIQKWYCCGYP